MKKVKQPHGGAIVHAEKGETANPNGRPKKIWKQMKERIEKEHGVKMTASEVKDIFLTLGTLDAEGLRAVAEDKTLPVVVSIYARAMYKESMSKKGEVRVAETVMDRAIGKSKQDVDIKTTGTVNTNVEVDPTIMEKAMESVIEKIRSGEDCS